MWRFTTAMQNWILDCASYDDRVQKSKFGRLYKILSMILYLRLLLILKYLLRFILDDRKKECFIDDRSLDSSIERISTKSNDKNITLRKMVRSRIFDFLALLKYLFVTSNFFVIQTIDLVSICRTVGLLILWPQNILLRNVQAMQHLFDKYIQVRK